MENTPQSRTTIQKIYDSIKRILNNFTKEGRYRNFVQDLEVKWREAYRQITTEQAVSNLNGETKHSTIGPKGAKNLSKSDVGREYKNLYRNQKVAKTIFKISKQDLENTNKITKRNTGWFKTKYGDWGTLITDKNARLTKQLEPSKTYRLGDIFEHDLLYKTYPKLVNMHIETADFPKGYERYNAFYNPIEKEIYFNNEKLKKLNIKGTLLHEINHYIEDIENFDKRSTGSGAIDKNTNRNENLGEIISNETKLYSEYSQKELDDIFPEQAKNNPTHANLKLELEKNRKQMYNKNERGVFDYETGKYTNEEESKSQNKKIGEIIKKGKTNTLKFEEELDNSSFSYDNQGRKLTKEQQEYFKDSKVRDENGNLLTMYHGSPNEFTVFDRNYSNANNNYGDGLYFTNIVELATNHSKDNKLYEVYLNVSNPLQEGQQKITKEQIKKYIKATKFNKQSIDFIVGKSATTEDIVNYIYDSNDDFSILELIDGFSQKSNLTKTIEAFNELNGTNYDGIITNRETIVFNPNQIKNIDNTNPTSNPDIRHSQDNKTWQQHLEENYKATGTRTNFSDIRQKTQVEETIKPIANEIKTLTDELKLLRKERK